MAAALNGDDTFSHFNPMIGATYRINSDVTAYAGYSQANRAPTPLGAGLRQSRATLHPRELPRLRPAAQAGRRAEPSKRACAARTTMARPSATLGWKLGVFRTDDQDDILNVPDPVQQGFGYFQNVGATRRQGVEAEVNFKADKFSVYASYSLHRRDVPQRADARLELALRRRQRQYLRHARRPNSDDPAPSLQARRRLFRNQGLQDRRRLARASARNITPATPPTSSRSFPATPSSTPTRPIR